MKTKALLSSAHRSNGLAPDGSQGFQLDAGINAFGGAFTDFDKKNFRLHFRSEYGASKLDFPLFEGFDEGVTPATDSFDQLEFRSGSHDRNQRGFGLSNRFVDETLLDAGHNVPHGRFVHIYINGEYWGQYHMRERWNDDFLASYYGGDEEDYEAINGNINNGNSTPNGWSPGDVFDGSGAAWDNVNAIVNTNSLSASQRFAALQQTVDLDEYVDYMLVWIAGQAENEYRSGGSTDGSVPYTFYLNDADGWLRDPVDGSGGQGGDKTGNAGPANILGRLVSEGDPEFMTYYADRIQNMFFNDGPLSTAQSTARLQEIIDQVDQSVILESARWSFSGEPGGGSLLVSQFEDRSQNALDVILPSILEAPVNRNDPRNIIERFRDRNVFPDFDAPEHLINGVIQDGGLISAGDQLTLSADDTIYFTLDGTDPRLPGGGISSNAILFSSSSSPVVLNSSTDVQSRSFSGGQWSALNSATFVIAGTQTAPQVINSIRDGGGVLARPDLMSTYSVTFDQDVNVSAGDLLVGNETFGVLVNTSGVGFSYNASTFTATWNFDSLPDLEASFYTLGLSNSITSTNGGEALDGDGDGAVGGSYFETIYVAIPGDANLDGDVEVNDINIFLGTNTGDGATVLSNLGAPGTFNWSQGDFNADGDVDSSQLNIFSGVQSGDYAVFLANLGRNVRPANSQFVTSQPVVSQPVVSQPVISQPVAAALVSLPVFSSVQSSFSVSEPIESSASVASDASVELSSFSSELLTNFVPASESALSGAQASFNGLNQDLGQLSSTTEASEADEANDRLGVAVDSSLELRGAHQLLDDIFSRDFDVAEYEVEGEADEADIFDFEIA